MYNCTQDGSHNQKNCIFCRMKITIQQYHHGAEIVKSNLNGFWLCRVLKGSIRGTF